MNVVVFIKDGHLGLTQIIIPIYEYKDIASNTISKINRDETIVFGKLGARSQIGAPVSSDDLNNSTSL